MLGITRTVDTSIRFCPHCQDQALVATRSLRLFGLRVARFAGLRLFQCRECLGHFAGFSLH